LRSYQVLRATTLRPTKEVQLTSLGVKDVVVERLAMSAGERAFYESVKERDLARDCGNHMVTMLRLRQAANTPQLARRRESGARKSMFLAVCVSIRQHASACLRVDAFGDKAFAARALR
jgi:hypothetical protein